MYTILIVEKDKRLRSVLKNALKTIPDVFYKCVNNEIDKVSELTENDFDLAVVNHSFNEHSTFALTTLIKQIKPNAQIFALSAPGKTLEEIKVWRLKTDSIDKIIEKPINVEEFIDSIEDALKSLSRLTTVSPEKELKAHLPVGFSTKDLRDVRGGDMVLSEKTILFLDIRNSTKLLEKEDIKNYAYKLNGFFTHLGYIIDKHDGEVIKYTGDGVLAVFGGFGRAHLAIKAAAEMVNDKKEDEALFKIGVGISDGLIMAGFVGTTNNLFYDVLGASVNIAARLCAKAGQDEIFITKIAADAANIDFSDAEILHVSVKGFCEKIQVIKFLP